MLKHPHRPLAIFILAVAAVYALLLGASYTKSVLVEIGTAVSGLQGRVATIETRTAILVTDADFERAARAAESRKIAMRQETILNATVRVEVGDGAGSGTMLTRRLALTNQHVVDGSSVATIRGWIVEGARTFPVTLPGRVVAGSKERDLALVEIEEDWPGPVAHFASDERPATGTAILVAGSPLGKRPHITEGAVRLPDDKSSVGMDALSVSAFVIWGNSGGGCYVAGEGGRYDLFGVPHAIEVKTLGIAPVALPHMAYCLPISSVRAFLTAVGRAV